MNYYFGKRFYLCGTIRYEFTTRKRERPAGGVPYLRLVAAEKGFIYHDGKANESAISQTVDYRTRILRSVANGDTAGVRATVSAFAGGSQSRTGTITPSADRTVPIAIGSPQTLSWQIKSNLPKPTDTGYSARFEWDTVQGKIVMNNTKFPASNPYNAEIALPTARCDNFQYISSEPGCVMAPSSTRRNLPVMDLTTTRNLATPSEATQLWDHVLTAQNSGVPGQPVALAAITGAGVAIQRIPDATQSGERGLQAKRNRSKACSRRSIYKPADGFGGYPSWQCDEYPFSSTHQGANLDPGNGRTRDWCFIKNLPINVFQSPGGWSACYIPTSMNNAGGQLIKPFNIENRILFRADDPRDGYFVSAYH